MSDVLFVIFNNKNSYEDLDIVMEDRPVIPSPLKNVIETVVEGRNGSLLEDLNTYQNIEIPIIFSLADSENLHARARQIKQWLIGTFIDNKLTFDDDLDYFYKVKYVKLDNLERELETIGRVTATFVCEPFCYSKEGLQTVILTKAGSLFNDGHISIPIIKLHGSGNITLNINGTVIILTGVDGYITIDSNMMDAYKDTTPKNSAMNGDFPILIEGKNNISWTGTVTKIEILPNWCYL